LTARRAHAWAGPTSASASQDPSSTTWRLISRSDGT
jgi:hypothetical protein